MTTATIEAPTEKQEQPVGMGELAIAQYREAVINAAKGDDTPQRQLLNILCLAGRSARQYESDVETVRKRLAAAEQLDQAAAMAAEIRDAQQAADAALEDLRRIRAECDQRIADADLEVIRLRGVHARMVDRRAALESKAREVLTATADRSIDSKVSAIRQGTAGMPLEQTMMQRDPRGRERAAAIATTRRNVAGEITNALQQKLAPENFALSD